MKPTALITAALVAGFVGGVLGDRISHFNCESKLPRVIRAHGFELLNEAGQPISYWGIDQGNDVVLAFARQGRAAEAPKGAIAVQLPRPLDDPHGQQMAIGLHENDSPFISLSGPDGKTRARLYLNLFSKPVLLMEDESGPRVSLGIVSTDTPGIDTNDWALEFSPERSSIGMFTRGDGKGTYVQGFLDVHKDRVKSP